MSKKEGTISYDMSTKKLGTEKCERCGKTIDWLPPYLGAVEVREEYYYLCGDCLDKLEKWIKRKPK